MSGTRSHSPKAPATEALIVAHGQPSDPDPAEAEIAALARRVAALLSGTHVRGVTLAAPGSLDRALAACGAPPVIYPLFMSDGWFTAQALPGRLNGSAGPVLRPLGLDPALAGLAADIVAGAAAARGWSSEAVTLVLAAHGSGRSPNAARATRLFADRLSGRLPLRSIRIGYVEEPPPIAEAAQGAGEASICLPFFAAGGGHVQDDVPEELAKAGFAGVVLDAIGLAPDVPALIAAAISGAAAPVRVRSAGLA